MYELLLELKERLNQIAIVGIGSISADFRLKKLQEKLKVLSAKAPVLAKLYELVTKLLEGQEVASNYMELNGLVDAILRTQGSSKVEGQEQEIETYQHISLKSLSFMQMQEVRNVLNGGTTTKWATLKRLYDEGNVVDYRLLEIWLKHLGDSYEYVDYDYSLPYEQREVYNVPKILMQYGKEIIPILLERFDTFKPTEKVNAIKIIYTLAKEEYNDDYKKWVQDEENDGVVAEALKALGSSKENLNFLLQFKTRKKKLQEPRLKALAQIISEYKDDQDELSHKALIEIKSQCLKDQELFASIFSGLPFLNEEEILNLILEKVHNLKEEKKLDKRGLYLNKEYTFFRSLVSYLDRYSSPRVLEVIQEIIDLKSEDGKAYFEASIGSDVIGSYLVHSTYQERLTFLASIKDSYNGYYLPHSFLAALKCYDSKKVYDEFIEGINHKPIKNITSIDEVLEQIASRHITPYGIDNIYYDVRTQGINLKNAGTVSIEIDKIKWDKCWLEYAEKQNSITLFTFLMMGSTKQEERQAYQNYYIYRIDELQAQIGEEEERYYITTTGSKREAYRLKIQYLFLGLMATGAKRKAINYVPYFIIHINDITPIICKYLNTEDLEIIDQLEATLENYQKNRRNKLAEFICRVRERVAK